MEMDDEGDGHSHNQRTTQIAALIIRIPPDAPNRRGTRNGDWILTEIGDPRDATDIAVARIRAAAHATVLVTQPWEHRVRVHGPYPLAAHLWGGDAQGTIEVISPCCGDAPTRLLSQGAWIANIGKHDAFITLQPPVSKPNANPMRPMYTLRIPPWNKAGLVAALNHPDAPPRTNPFLLQANRFVADTWVKQEGTINDRAYNLIHANAFESTLVWWSPQATNTPTHGPATQATTEPGIRVGCINMAGTIGSGGDAPRETKEGTSGRHRTPAGVHRLNDLAQWAEERRYDILFVTSCGHRHTATREVGRQWLCFWSHPGGTDQEGVCALVRKDMSLLDVSSEHHNVLAIRTQPRGTRTTRADLDIGVYAPGDERWHIAMDIVRRHVAARLGVTRVYGDINNLDPADPDAARDPNNARFAAFLDDTGLAVAALEDDAPTQFGGGEDNPHLRRIDHILLSCAAERYTSRARIIWDPRFVVDHALIELVPETPAAETATDCTARWRVVNYRPRTTTDKLEWLNAAWILTRACTAADTPAELDARLTAAAHAALTENTTFTTHRIKGGDLPAAAAAMTSIAQWARDRLHNKPADVLRVEHLILTPTDPTTPNAGRVDAARAIEAMRRMRGRARAASAARRAERRDKRKEWEADCMPSDRGVTKRLMGKKFTPPIAVVERADGTMCSGEQLADEVWAQSRGRRSDPARRASALRFLADFPGDKIGPQLTAAEAADRLWGLNPSAPGVDNISAPMMRLVAAWDQQLWLLW
eukprot:gene7747-10946_t